MEETRLIMGMPITVTLRKENREALEATFAYFSEVDAQFSTYKEDSEVMRLNRGEIEEMSPRLGEVLALVERTRVETQGYFNARRPDGTLDPSGVVKGWAINEAARRLSHQGVEDYCIDAGGDIASRGVSVDGTPWRVGIRSPFTSGEIVKVVVPRGRGVATSGSYIRGAHIYNPHAPEEALTDIVSLTVIGPDVLEADRFATGAFAMGRAGVAFIEELLGFEAYAIDATGRATMTSGFPAYTL